MTARDTLKSKIARARTNAGRRGYAVTFTGPAATAYTRGCVDGYDGRPDMVEDYPTAVEREAYAHGRETYYRSPRDRCGCRYEQALF
jgi:hypothetical protein